MDFRGFTDMGSDIGRRVNDAVMNGNYETLNRDIKNIFSQAFDKDSGYGGLDGKLYREEPAVKPQVKKKENSIRVKQSYGIPVAKKLPGKPAGIIMMVAGYGVTAIFGIATFILICGAGFLGGLIPGASGAEMAAAGSALLAPFTVAGAVTGVAGTRRYNLAKRIRTYISVLGGRTYCTIRELADRINKKPRYVVRDLKKMIEKGYFPEGHIDDHKTNFIATNEMYQQYLLARDSAQTQEKEAEPEPQFSRVPESVQQVLEEGEAYLRTIREANDAIYDPVISEKLYRMEVIVKKIFMYVKDNPDQIGQLRRFMSYYMPTTEKLVKAYRQLDEENIRGTNMNRAKDEISQTLDTINEAYEKLYDSMYVDVAMDVSSDISVLKTIFAQEGLTKDELNGGK